MQVSMKSKKMDMDSAFENMSDDQLRKVIEMGQANKVLADIKQHGLSDPALNEKIQNIDMNDVHEVLSNKEIFNILRSAFNDPMFMMKIKQEQMKKGQVKRTCKECGDKFSQDGKIKTAICPACKEANAIDLGTNIPDICVVCKKSGNKQCARCKSVKYCSAECQRKDWLMHKNKCKPKK